MLLLWILDSPNMLRERHSLCAEHLGILLQRSFLEEVSLLFFMYYKIDQFFNR